MVPTAFWPATSLWKYRLQCESHQSGFAWALWYGAPLYSSAPFETGNQRPI